MKRKLSLLMAFMMAATLLPATPSFAATTNTIDRQWVLNSDDEIELNTTTAPTLTIKKDGKDTPNGYFELKLGDDAEWLYSSTRSGNYNGLSGAEVVRLTDTLLGVYPDGRDIKIPMYVKLDSASDLQKVTVIRKESTVSAGEYTYASVGKNDVKIKVEKKEKISRNGDTLIRFSLDEVSKKGLENGREIRLRLPKGFAWDTEKQEGRLHVDKLTTKSDSDGRILVINPTGLSDTAQESIYFSIAVQPSRDARYGDVDVTVEGNSDVSPSSLVIAEYVPYDVTVKAEKVLDVLAGRDVEGAYVANLTIEEPATASLQGKRYATFKFVDENDNTVDASLQDGEQLKLEDKGGDATLLIDVASLGDFNSGKGKLKNVTIDTTKAGEDNRKVDSFDIYVNTQSTDRKAKYELKVPFVVDSGFTGKLYLQAEGAGIAKQKVQIADVKAPVTFDVEKPLPQVKIGLQKQKASDITVTETQAGALQDYVPGKNSNYATYSFDPAEKFGLIFKDADFEVVDGDISIRNLPASKDRIFGSNASKGLGTASHIGVQVDRKSTKASKFKVKNITVTLDRTVPYGDIKLNGKFGVVAERHDLSNTVSKLDFFTTVTPVSTDKRATTVFEIGNPSYFRVNDKVKTEVNTGMAPFIQNGRTMLPMRVLSDVLGAKLNYDADTRQATFRKDSTITVVTLDSDTLYVNGSPVKMDAKPVIKEERMYLPLVYVATAFGLENGKDIIWNDSAKTVTILPQDATAEELKEAVEGKVLENATEKKEETK